MKNESKTMSEIEKSLHDQHYYFAHILIPNIIENNFWSLIKSISENNLQEYMLDLWNGCASDVFPDYSKIIYPTCDYIKKFDNIGIIYINMPAPRQASEAVYSTILFLIDNSSNDWKRSYFTLEFGWQRWAFKGWSDSFTHCSYESEFDFGLEPNLDNFINISMKTALKIWKNSQSII